MSVEFFSLSTTNGICYIGKDKSDIEAKAAAKINSNIDKIIIEYDPSERAVYSLDRSDKIYKINLDSHTQNIVYEFTGQYSAKEISSVALDWVTKNLYFFHDKTLSLINLNNPSKRPITFMRYGSQNLIVKVFPTEVYLVLVDADSKYAI